MRKDDVEYHRLGYGYDSAPAVNVKVSWPYGDKRRELFEQVERDEGLPGFAAYAEELYDQGWPEWTFEAACESAWEMLQSDAEEIFGKGTKVYSEGRSGGWAYIHGMTAEDVESWDAITLGQWAKFAKWARAYADDIPYQEASLVAINDYAAMSAGPPLVGVGY